MLAERTAIYPVRTKTRPEAARDICSTFRNHVTYVVADAFTHAQVGRVL
jgi:hypothetical protein